MYKTCIYCQRHLGLNETVENFPVGRRIAFDQERGRLWVVCDRCRRWNLSPLDERWEAIEECERQYRDTSTRFSTDNIGLARLPEGLELVRIGRPQRREFAAWRYGRQFLRRRIKTLIGVGMRIGAAIGMASFGVYIFGPIFAQQENRIIARVRSSDGRRLKVTLKDAKKMKLLRAPERSTGWTLNLPHRIRESEWGILGSFGKGKPMTEDLEGPVAIQAAGLVLPKVNQFGGSNAQVRDAVEMIEEARGPDRFFASAAVEPGEQMPGFFFPVDGTRVIKQSAEVRLALEMAAHEESERRALEGELEMLEEAWREAEEIAAIADRLLIPESIENWIRTHKKNHRL